MERIYHDPQHPASLGGVTRLSQATGQSKKVVADWLAGQDVYTLHRPARRRFQRNRVVTNGLHDQWCADLVFIPHLAAHNDGMRYLLTVIDGFSRYAYVVPLRRKSSAEVIGAFKTLFRQVTPNVLNTDAGTEFTNKAFQAYLKKMKVGFFTSVGEQKVSLVERFNRTIKSRLYRYMTLHKTKRILEVLPKIVAGYNSAIHRTIGMAPRDVNLGNEYELWMHQYGTEVPRAKAKFKVGDTVRLSHVSNVFKKAYEGEWTGEIFRVSKVYDRPRPMYKIVDFDNKEIVGSFYNEELQHVKISDQTMYDIENILDRQRRGRIYYVLVKWKNYQTPSWVPEDNIVHYGE